MTQKCTYSAELHKLSVKGNSVSRLFKEPDYITKLHFTSRMLQWLPYMAVLILQACCVGNVFGVSDSFVHRIGLVLGNQPTNTK